MEQVLSFLNQYANLVLAGITFILVIITAVYAYYTSRMAKIMSRQVIADLMISNIVLRSYYFEPEAIQRDDFNRFELMFNIRNKSSGSGSIDKPALILRFANDGFERILLPETKNQYQKRSDNNTYEIITEDLGATVFLRGGDSHRVELEYYCRHHDEDFLSHIKEHFKELEYYIRFSDNLGEKHTIKIDDVRPSKSWADS